MTRKKVKLAWIGNDSARRASLKKRRLGLLKKVSELTTLCGVSACVIMYSPDETEPVVWPSHAMVQQQLARFKSMPELDQLKKMMNQETYLRERVGKVQEQLVKCQRRNKEVEMAHLMHQIYQGRGLDELNLHELHGLAWLVEEKIKEIRQRIDFYQQATAAAAPLPNNFGPASALPPPRHNLIPLSEIPPPQRSAVDETAPTLGSGDGRRTNPTDSNFLWDQWFLDMMNNTGTIEHKSASSSSSSSIARTGTHDHMGLPFDHPPPPGQPRQQYNYNYNYSSFGGGTSITAADVGLPLGNFRPAGRHGATAATHDHMMGLHPHGTTTLGSSSDHMGMGLHPYGGHTAGSSSTDPFGLPPFGLFGANSSSGGGTSDVGFMPTFDGKNTNWPNNFSP